MKNDKGPLQFLIYYAYSKQTVEWNSSELCFYVSSCNRPQAISGSSDPT